MNDPVIWAFDTETVKGKAVLLTVAHPDGRAAYLEFPKSFRQIVGWLNKFAAKYTAYNMDYDARAILKFLPKKVWTCLYRDERAQWGGMNISYRVGRYFQVSMDGESILSIFDCATYFQKSMRAAAEETLHDVEKGSIPSAWYKDMGAALRDPRRKKRVLLYAVQDAHVCARLWEFLNKQFAGLGVPAETLARPLSPGSIAAGYFGQRIASDIPPWANWTAKRAYAGGRIEVYQRGMFPRVWVYDIKSAYPWALANLPHPAGLEIVRADGTRPDAAYSILHVVLRIHENVVCPPVPAWGDKTRVFPTGYFSTWITRPEYDYCKRKGWVRDILDGIHLVGERRPWLPDIAELFLLRKTRPEISMAIKLVLNSIYGKLGEMGEAWKESFTAEGGTRKIGGRFVSKTKHLSAATNFFAASYVTALVRLRIQEVIDRVGADNAVLSATDGLVLTAPLPATMLGGNLGQWALTAEKARACVVGSGVYSLFYDGSWHDKNRGYRMTAPLVEVLDRASTRIRIKSRMAYTLGDWAMKGVELNDMVDLPRTLDVNFDHKRQWPRPWKHGRDVLKGRMSSLPPVLLEDIKSEGRT